MVVAEAADRVAEQDGVATRPVNLGGGDEGVGVLRRASACHVPFVPG